MVADHEYAIYFAVSHQVISQFEFEEKFFFIFLLVFGIFTNFAFMQFASNLITDSTQVGIANHEYEIYFAVSDQVFHNFNLKWKFFSNFYQFLQFSLIIIS